MGLVSGESLSEWGQAVRIQLVSSRMPAPIPLLLLIMGNLLVRYLARDTYLPSLFPQTANAVAYVLRLFLSMRYSSLLKWAILNPSKELPIGV